MLHGDVGDIGGPYLIGPVDGQMAQQIGKDPVLGMGPAGARLGVYGPRCPSGASAAEHAFD